MEKERLREIALEFKQSGAFSSITHQTAHPQLNPFQTHPSQSASILSSFPTFTTFPVLSTPSPVIEMPLQLQQPKAEVSQAFLEAVAASQRITASKNFAEMFNCTNSNDSTSNGPFNEESSSSSK